MTKKYPILDGHNDTVLHLMADEQGQARDFFAHNERGHIDLPRAKQGGLAGGFFAIYVPNPASDQEAIAAARAAQPPQLPPPLTLDYAQQFVFKALRTLYDVEKQAEGQVKITRTVAEIEQCLADDVLAMILHFEGAEAIDSDFDALEVFYQAGLRSLGLVWSRPTIYGEGVPFRFPSSPDTGDGLTQEGKALVKRCNELGILIDLSHLNEKGFWDVARLSTAPLVATHSNVHALSATPRNLTDKQLDAIKDSDGMVGLNFATVFLHAEGINGRSAEQLQADTTLELMVQHVDYLVERLGIDRVGLGSDFDGAGVSDAIKDVAGLPHLIAALAAAGYNEEALNKLTHQNWLRVLRQTWQA